MTDPLAYKQFWNQFSGSQGNQREIATYDNMMREYAMIKGIPITYYTINVDSYKDGMDQIYGENSRPKWDKKYTLVAILEEFTPETQEWGLRGLTNTDEITLFIHKSMFDELIGIRSLKTPSTSKERRGAFGPISKDQIMTPHNGIIYEVLTGGVHFLPNEAQMFGRKFWYKATCKVREVSDAVLGEGEQYGAIPDELLDSKWKGNPQYLLDNPSRSDWVGKTGTPKPTIITPPSSGCPSPEYQTTGTPDGPSDGSVPSDLVDTTTGNVKQQYIGDGMKDNSTFGDNADVQKEAEQIINPETDGKVDPDSEEGKKYGPNGRIIPNPKNKELFGDW